MKDLPLYIGGTWRPSVSDDVLNVINPATAEMLSTVPMASRADVDLAVTKAQEAFIEWRRTPVTERSHYLYAFRAKLEEYFEEIARVMTLECGKTISESRGELRRGIENVEVACGTPSMMQGRNTEDVSRGIDEHLIRQPLGVVVAITSFNFPDMIPLWFLPTAIATRNCFILKPSGKTPRRPLGSSDFLMRLDYHPELCS